MNQLISDLNSKAFRKALIEESTKQTPESSTKKLHKKSANLEDQISKTLEMAAALEDPAPALRKVDELERKKKGITEELNRIRIEEQHRKKIQKHGAFDIQETLNTLAEQMHSGKSRRVLESMVDRVELDPANLDAQIFYKLETSRSLSMASARGLTQIGSGRSSGYARHRYAMTS